MPLDSYDARKRHAAKAFRKVSIRQSGIAALEFVLILPFLLIVLFGIVDVSLLYHDKLVLDNAAREAARVVSMFRVPPLSASQEQTLATTIMTNYASGSLFNSGASSLPVVTLTHLACDSAITTCPGANSLGMAVQVQLTYSYRGLVLGSAFSAITGLVNLSSTSLMYYE